MPEIWSSLLQHSKITKQEQKQNPQAVIHALDFYQHAAQKRESKFMYSSYKSSNKNKNKKKTFFANQFPLDLTPPSSLDLADKFRQTVILVSVRINSISHRINDCFFFSFI